MSEAAPPRRLKMRALLGPSTPAVSAGVRVARPADRQALADLLITAYAGTIDDAGETPEEALAEIDRTLGGAYGPYLEDCSFLVESAGAVVAASLITQWAEAPLVAFVMVAPGFQRRGLGELLLRRSMAALHAKGEGELLLFVTDGNAPAQQLYERLGFTVVEPPA
jgi:ribosomal protein S18 acetylase RimI-like enzyme